MVPLALRGAAGCLLSLVACAAAVAAPVAIQAAAGGATGTQTVNGAQTGSKGTVRSGGQEHVEQLQQNNGGGSGALSSGGAMRATPSTEASAAARRAWGFYEQGNLEAAATAFKDAVRERHVRPWVHYAYGLTEYGLSDFHEAIHQWKQVRKAVPTFEPVYLDLADGYLRAGLRHKALKMLHTAAKRWPHDPQPFDAMGVAQVQMHKLDDAERSFKHALGAAPDDGLAYFNLGKVYELRYIKSRGYRLIMGRYIKPPRKKIKPGKDSYRLAAITAFKHYLKIGGPFASEAQNELIRLEYEGIIKQPR